MTKEFELTPIDSRKSFYGKCKVLDSENFYILVSYDTEVAGKNKETGEITITKNPKHLTQTTLRHINAFLNYLGEPTTNKKEILAK